MLLSDGIKGRVQNVCFSTKSVRIRMPGDGMNNWYRCELIEAHTTQKGGTCDPASIIEDLHNKLMAANETIEKKSAKIKEMEEKMNKNYLKDAQSLCIKDKHTACSCIKQNTMFLCL